MDNIEEKEVTFNIVTKNNDDGEITEIVGITSDIDDCPDYISISERICLMTEVIGQCLRIIDKNVLSQSGVLDFDENNQEHIAFKEALDSFENQIIYVIINLINNFARVKFKEKPQQLEYSLVVFSKLTNIFGISSNDVEYTLHSDDIQNIDPLQGSYALFLDTIQSLLDNNRPIEDVKHIVMDFSDAIREITLDDLNENT